MASDQGSHCLGGPLIYAPVVEAPAPGACKPLASGEKLCPQGHLPFAIDWKVQCCKPQKATGAGYALTVSPTCQLLQSPLIMGTPMFG